jgi:hypothetical protein
MNDQTPLPNPEQQQKIFFTVACLITYLREEAPKQRHLNILLELEDPNITSKVMQNVHRAALERLKKENDVPPEQVRDFVILGISLLGQMTPEEFHAKD